MCCCVRYKELHQVRLPFQLDQYPSTNPCHRARHVIYDSAIENIVDILDEVMGDILREVASIAWKKYIHPRLMQ